MSLPINRSAKSTLDANLINGNTSDAPAIKNSNDVVYNGIDEVYAFVQSLVTSGTLSPIPPDFMQRQAIINGNFDVAQRGVAWNNQASLSYLLDRWQIVCDTSSVLPTNISNSRQPLISGSIPGSYFYHRVNWDGAGSGVAAGSYYFKCQKIENGTRFLCGAGTKVTVSFWARSSIANKRIGVGLIQDYGTGGTPSTEEVLPGQAITLTPAWTKYSVTFTTNALTGKIFGSNNDDILRLAFFYMWGSGVGSEHLASAATETFVGVGSMDIAQVQVNAGDQALPFQPRSFPEELALCQRYYEKSYSYLTAPATATSVGKDMTVIGDNTGSSYIIKTTSFKVTKRIAPTINYWDMAGNANKITTHDSALAGNNNVATSVPPSSISDGQFNVGVSGVGLAGFSLHWAADAEL